MASYFRWRNIVCKKLECIVLLLLVVSLILLIIFSVLAYSVESWNTADGQVLSAKISENHFSRSNSGFERDRITYSFKIVYEYNVNNKKYSGSRLDFNFVERFLTNFAMGDFKRAVSLKHKYPVGKRVTVHYNSMFPWISVLDTRVAWWPKIILFILLAAFIIFVLKCKPFISGDELNKLPQDDNDDDYTPVIDDELDQNSNVYILDMDSDIKVAYDKAKNINPELFFKGKEFKNVNKPILFLAKKIKKDAVKSCNFIYNDELLMLVSPEVARLVKQGKCGKIQLLNAKIICSDGICNDFKVVNVCNVRRIINYKHPECEYDKNENGEIDVIYTEIACKGALRDIDIAFDQDYRYSLFVHKRFKERFAGKGIDEFCFLGIREE